MLFSPTKSASSFFLLFFMVLTAEAASLFKDQLYRMQRTYLENIICLELSDACSQPISATEFGDLNRELLVDTTKVVYDVVEIQPSPAGGMAGWQDGTNTYRRTYATRRMPNGRA